MSGVCTYCGFSGTNDEMAEHAGDCSVWLDDSDPELYILGMGGCLTRSVIN